MSEAEVEIVQEHEREEMLVRTKQYQAELEAIREFEITDAEDYATSAEVLREVKALAKEIEARRKKVTEPLNAALKEFGKWYKPALDTLGAMELLLKRKLTEYTEAERVRNEAAMRKAAAEASAGNFEGAHAASKQIVPETKAAGITSREVWHYRIVDLSKVDRRYLCLDHSAVKIHIKDAGKAPPEPIEGLEFYTETSLSARA